MSGASEGTGTAAAPQKGDKQTTCEEIGNAIASGKVGDIVAKHEKLILQYYEDVQKQAKQSFESAKSVALIGFWVLITTLAYSLLLDLLSHFRISGLDMATPSKAVIGMGAVSATLMEFIAGVNFWLYSRASKQFGAFHICLERTHRYLVAYKIAEETGHKKAEVLEKLACIMASAPMITYRDLDGANSEPDKKV